MSQMDLRTTCSKNHFLCIHFNADFEFVFLRIVLLLKFHLQHNPEWCGTHYYAYSFGVSCYTSLCESHNSWCDPLECIFFGLFSAFKWIINGPQFRAMRERILNDAWGCSADYDKLISNFSYCGPSVQIKSYSAVKIFFSMKTVCGQFFAVAAKTAAKWDCLGTLIRCRRAVVLLFWNICLGKSSSFEWSLSWNVICTMNGFFLCTFRKMDWNIGIILFFVVIVVIGRGRKSDFECVLDDALWCVCVYMRHINAATKLTEIHHQDLYSINKCIGVCVCVCIVYRIVIASSVKCQP